MVSLCPKCQHAMIERDGRMVCSNSDCLYLGWDVPKYMPTYDELLKRVEELEKNSLLAHEIKMEILEFHYTLTKKLKSLEWLE